MQAKRLTLFVAVIASLAAVPMVYPVTAYAADAAPLSGHYFNFRKTSIYGGSNEIQKNIISQMILGL